MSWSISNPPSWAPDAVATERGWVDPATGEVLVAIGSLNSRNVGAQIVSVSRIGSIFRYGLGAVMSFRVKYNEVVVVTGTPQIAVSFNGTAKNLLYVSGSGTSSLVFSYTIEANAVAAAGQFTVASPVVLNGGTIQDAFEVNATLTFTEPNTTQISSNTTAPAIDSFDFVGKDYVTGEVFAVDVVMTKAVNVTGLPLMDMGIGADTKTLTYLSGSGTDTLTFGYTVLADDEYNEGTVVDDTDFEIALNGGTIKDLHGNAMAVFAAAMPDMATVGLNSAAAPTFTVTAPAKKAYSGAVGHNELVFTATATKPVVVTGAPSIAIALNGSARQAVFSGGSGTNVLTFTYPVTTSDAATAGQVTVTGETTGSITLNSGTVAGANGTNATLTFTKPTVNDITINNTAATISGVVASADGDYETGDVVSLTATFTKAVAVTNSPKIAVTVDGQTRYAFYASGTGTTEIVFSYTVGAGDAAALTEFASVSPITKNGGTIVDVVGIPATLTFTPPDTDGISINA